MPEILQYGFMQRALLAGAVIGTIAPVIGVFLVLRRLSLIADTLAHVALAGVAVGLLLGAYPVAGALVAALLGAVGIERLRTVGRLSGETALAIFLSGGLAVAVVVIGLAGGFNVGLFTYLFGAITAVQPRDLWVILILGLVVLGAVAVLYKELFAITFDEQGARVQGLPVEGLNLLLTVLVAVTAGMTIRARCWRGSPRPFIWTSRPAAPSSWAASSCLPAPPSSAPGVCRERSEPGRAPGG